MAIRRRSMSYGETSVGHGHGRRGAVPVFLAGGEADDVTRTDFLDGASFALGAAAAGGDDQSLAERMRVPGSAGAGFEGHGITCGPSAFAGGYGATRKQRVNTHRAGEPVGAAWGGRLGAGAFDLHERGSERESEEWVQTNAYYRRGQR